MNAMPGGSGSHEHAADTIRRALITSETQLDRIIRPAIAATGNERWGGEDAWEIRDRRGKLLYTPAARGGFDTIGELQAHGEIEDEALFVNLRPGVGA